MRSTTSPRTPTACGVAALTRKLWLGRLQQLGYDPKASESLVDTDLRGHLLTAFGDMGDPAVVEEARRRFAKLASDPRSLDGPLKTVWLAIAARNATPAEWDRLAAMAADAPNAVERQAYYRLLGATRDKALAQKGARSPRWPARPAPAARRSSPLSRSRTRTSPTISRSPTASRSRRCSIRADGRPSIRGSRRARDDPAIIGKLEAFAKTLPEDERRPVNAQIAALREQQASEPRLARQAASWLDAR